MFAADRIQEASTVDEAPGRRPVSRPSGSLDGLISLFPERHGAYWRDALLRRMLALADVLAVLVTSLAMGTVGKHGLDTAFWIVVTLPGWILLAKLEGLYDRDHRALRHLTVDELPAILVWAFSASSLAALIFPVLGLPPVELRGAFELGLLVSLCAFAFRGSARLLWRNVTPPDRTIIVGQGPLAHASHRKLELFSDIHVELVGERASLGNGDLTKDSAWSNRLDRVIVASNDFDDDDLVPELLAFCRDRKIKLSVVPAPKRMFGVGGRLNHIADLPLIEYSTWDVSRSTKLLKRALDAALSLTLILALTPLLLLIALAIRLDSCGPVLFVQQRAGRHGRPFRMLKFRTMVADAEERLDEVVVFDSLRDPMFKLRRDPRVTHVGRILRRASLDELPQLLNALKGDMSLVGPRPEQVELVERYRPEHLFRLTVRPGVTGPMQVFGRGDLMFEERLAVERDYIDNLSFGRDLRILLLTLGTVIKGNGAY
jgi:exopolysaccharide biosynthesis polyprenyl glycosylphosphotransferase